MVTNWRPKGLSIQPEPARIPRLDERPVTLVQIHYGGKYHRTADNWLTTGLMLCGRKQEGFSADHVRIAPKHVFTWPLCRDCKRKLPKSERPF